jgi:hypothetical protein
MVVDKTLLITGIAGKLFQAVGVALPPKLQELPLTTPQPAA